MQFVSSYTNYPSNGWLLGSWDLHVTSSCHCIKIYSINKTRPATRARMALMEAHGVMSFEPLTLPLEFGLESEEEYLEKMRRNPREPKD